mgnify:CR=1 FL=1
MIEYIQLIFCIDNFLMLYLLLFALYWLTKKRKRPLSWIPGPSGLPLLGNILQIDTERPHHSVTELAGKYGPVYKISMLGLPIVVVSGQRELHEVFVKKGQDFAGRMKNFLLDHGSKGKLKYTCKYILMTIHRRLDLKWLP